MTSLSPRTTPGPTADTDIAAVPVDLDAADLTWVSHLIAGSDLPASLVLLHADAERQTRTVLVAFPDNWRRDAVGHQPAGEEMVLLTGALSISGSTAAAGEYLLVEPRATRAATSAANGTRALIFFSGSGGGWTDGAAAEPGAVSVAPLTEGAVRAPQGEMSGLVEVFDTVSSRVFDTPVDIVWPAALRWVHLPAGAPAPDVDGVAVVRTWA